MSAASTWDRWPARRRWPAVAGHVGPDPVARSWSTAHNSVTATPWRSMIERLRLIGPWVWLGSGERLRVQFTYNARRPSNRHSSGMRPPRVWVLGSPAGIEQHLDQQCLADQQPDHHGRP